VLRVTVLEEHVQAALLVHLVVHGPFLQVGLGRSLESHKGLYLGILDEVEGELDLMRG
jgi:hypothetical protein